MEQELLEAIEQLNDTIKALNSSLGLRRSSGRGGRPAPGPKTADDVGSFNNSLGDLTKTVKKSSAVLAGLDASAFNRAAESGDKATASLRKFGNKLDDQTDSVEKNTDAIEKEIDSRRDLTAEQKAAIRAQKAEAQSQKENQKKQLEAQKDEIEAKQTLAKATADLVTSLASGSGNFAAAMSDFGKAARNSSENLSGGLRTVAIGASRLANLLSSLAGGAAFALTMMNAFAKDARAASDFVDLRNLNAGTITTQKLYSALGDSFVKVINESGGAFRFFGATSQEAVENLAALSRGLRNGAANQRILNNLGPEYARYFEQAASATAALGLSQEEQASLQSSIMSSVRLGAKNEVDAQQMLVRQYATTTESARTLSQQFGVSARDILKTMQEFNRSRIGQALGMRGLGSQGQEVFAQLKMAAESMGANLSAEDLQRVTMEVLRGNLGTAQSIISEQTTDNQAAGMVMRGFVEDIGRRRQLGETITSESATSALRGSLEQNRTTIESLSNLPLLRGSRGEQAAGALGAQNLLEQMRRGTEQQQTDRDTRGQRRRTDEAANIRGTEQVQQAIDFVKSTFIGIGAAAVGVLTTFGLLSLAALAATASLYGMSKLNAARALASSALSGAAGAAGTAASAAGAAGTAAGAARGAAAVAPAAASAAGSAGAMAKLGQAASTGVASGPGQAIAGFFAAFGGPMALKVVAGAGVIASVVAILGAGVAGGLYLVSLGLKSFSEGLKSLDTIDGDNLERVGQSLKSLGAGMLAFAVASGANVLGAVANGIAGIFGADIVSRIRKAVDELAPVAPQLSIIGPAIQSFGEGLRLFGEAAANIDANRLARILALVRGAGAIDAERLRTLSTLNLTGSTAPAETRAQRISSQRAAGIFEGASTPVDEFAPRPIVFNGRQIGYFDEVGAPVANSGDAQLFQDLQSRLRSMLMPAESRAVQPEMPITDVRSTVGTFGNNNTAAGTVEPAAGEAAAPAADRESSNEVFKQTLIAYLSTVADDIAAIRGNTRTATGDLLSPVRLG